MDLVLKIKLSLKEALCGFSLEKHINEQHKQYE
jgi:hypothetical protein